MSNHVEPALIRQRPQAFCLHDDRHLPRKAVLSPDPGMGDGKIPGPFGIEFIKNGVEMGLQFSPEAVTGNFKALQLHFCVQPNHHEPGEQLAFLDYERAGKKLQVEACLNDHGSRLFPACNSRNRSIAVCGQRLPILLRPGDDLAVRDQEPAVVGGPPAMPSRGYPRQVRGIGEPIFQGLLRER